MTNNYFDSSDYTALTRNTLARAEQVNDIASAVVAGFDLLPGADPLKQNRVTYAATVGGTANAITITLTSTISSYTAGLSVSFKAASDNTGATTINVDSVGVKSIKAPGGSALAGGEIQQDAVVTVAYNGTDFILTSGYVSAEEVTLAAISSDITTVAGISGNVTTVAGISGNVTTVAGISGNVTTVAGISGNVTTVAGVSANVTTVAGISSDVTAVAAIDSDVSVVAASVSGVGTLAAIAGLSSTGLISRTGSGTASVRTLTGTSAEITVTNGNGVSGNPTISLPTALTFTGKTVTGGTFAAPALSGIVGASGITAFDIPDSSLIIANFSNPTKIAKLDASGITAGQVRTFTFPDADATLVGTTLTQTLTNKTLTAPTVGGTWTASGATCSDLGTVTTADINGGTIDGTVIGATTPAAITGTTITASTGFIGSTIGTGSTGDWTVTTSGGTQFRVKHRANAVNQFAVQGSSTGNDVFLHTEGSDPDIDLAFVLKGAAALLTYNAAGGTLLTTLNSAGDLLPGTTETQDLGSASKEWDNLFVQNAVTVSDRRAKDAIADIPYGLDFINAVRPVVYRHKSKTATVPGVDADGAPITSERTITYNRLHAGLVAQEVKSAMDGLGISTTDFAGYVDASVNGGPDKLMLRYPEFIPVLIKAVQEIDARLTALEAT